MAVQDIITEHLDIWTSAVKAKSASGRGSSKKLDLYGIKKLRELILELAVRGKLVPQDPNDEPASELLRRIETEKLQLVKDKKIKKPKNLTEIDRVEHPFKLPLGWSFNRLNDWGEWGAGSTPKRSQSEYYGGEIPWFKSGELSNDFIAESEEKITEKALKETSVRLNKTGDVLVAMYGATIGKCSILLNKATTNQAVCACTPFNGIYNEFLLTVLKGYKKRLIGMGAGGAQPNISREKIIATVVALPPEAEQHRIVAKVDELMALCDQLESQTEYSIEAHKTLVEILLATLTNAKDADEFSESWQRISQHFDVLFTTEDSINQLKQTILQLAVMGKLVKQDPFDEPASKLLERIAAEKQQLIQDGKIKKQKPLPQITDEEKPFDVPNGWEWSRVWAIAHTITSGSRDWAKYYADDGAIFVTMGNLSRGHYQLRLDNLRYVNPPKVGEGNRTRLEENDLLISITGDVGNLGLIPKDFGEAYINQHTAMLRFMPEFQNRFFPELMRSPVAKFQFDAPQRGIKNSFRLGDVGEMVIPIPPIMEQRRIAIKVEELMVLCDSLKKNLNQAQTTQLLLADAIIFDTFSKDKIDDKDKVNLDESNTPTEEQLLTKVNSLIGAKRNYLVQTKPDPIIEKCIGFMVSGDMGVGGVEYVKFSKLVTTLRSICFVEDKLGISGIPLLGSIVTKVLDSFGVKVHLNQSAAVVLLCFPPKMTRTTMELLDEVARKCKEFRLPLIDEQVVSQIINNLSKDDLISRVSNESWQLKKKFRHEIKHW